MLGVSTQPNEPHTQHHLHLFLLNTLDTRRICVKYIVFYSLDLNIFEKLIYNKAFSDIIGGKDTMETLMYPQKLL